MYYLRPEYIYISVHFTLQNMYLTFVNVYLTFHELCTSNIDGVMGNL